MPIIENLIIQDIMTTNVVSVRRGTMLLDGIRILSRSGFSGLPVVDDHDMLVGILTYYDLISKGIFTGENSFSSLTENSIVSDMIFSEGGIMKKFSELRVEDVMNPGPLVFKEDATFVQVVGEFKKHHRVDSVPVVTSENKLVGIVARSDVFRPFRFRFLLMRYQKFLQRSFHSLSEDIERPYHKIVNLVLKIVGISFLILGIWLMYVAAVDYVEFHGHYVVRPAIPDYFSAELDQNRSGILSERDANLYNILFLTLFGLGSLLIFVGISAVLLLRYIAFTLPDRLYFRIFAPIEDKYRKQKKI